MFENNIKKILTNLSKKKISPDEAFNLLRDLPFEDLGFAKVDHHRTLRKGYPEVIFCKGKTKEQVAAIVARMLKSKQNILATKADKDIYSAVKKIAPKASFDKYAKLIYLTQKKIAPKTKNKIAIITAGTADIPIAKEASITAQFLGNPIEEIFDVGVAGIHRLMAYKNKIAKANVIIVIAGMEGALASVVGGLFHKPVIAVPTSVGYGASFEGLAALLSMLNSCTPGISVVNIDNGFGAACVASLINQR